MRYSSPPDRPRGARRLLRHLSIALACFSLTAYFAYHIRYGRHGLEVRDKLIARSALLDFEIKGLETVRTKLRHAHPWFGPLDAAGWHAMAAMHMGIHRKQIERILS